MMCWSKLNIDELVLFRTMACFYVIYMHVFSEWRSIRPVEINQCDFTMATHYDITMGNDAASDIHCDVTMGNDISRNAHCEITMGKYVARDIPCDITMSNGIAMYTYHGITIHNDVAMNLFYYVLSALCLIAFYYG